MTEDRRIEPPPHLLEQWVQAAREAAKKGGPYAKTFAMAAIDWALNSQPAPNDHQIGSLEITPPPELVQQWCHEDGDEIKTSPRWYQIVAAKAARWGADQELEACCEHIRNYQWGFVDLPDGTKGMHRAVDLKFARRPKPPSLKEQAIAELELLRGDANTHGLGFDSSAIRRALESLPD